MTTSSCVDTYTLARKRKPLKGLRPAPFIWKEWLAKPDLFIEGPCHLTLGQNTQSGSPVIRITGSQAIRNDLPPGNALSLM